MSNPKELNPLRDIRFAARAGVVTLAIVIGTAGVWAATAPLAGAVIAAGQVVVESNVRRIQHPTGGVVAEIFVTDGAHVRTGDVLIRLDETTARANLAVIEVQLRQLVGRKARLEAERDRREDVAMPAELLQSRDPAVAKIVQGELTLFKSRREAAQGQVSQLRERITQTQEEIRGLSSQIAASKEQNRLIQLELEGVNDLFSKNLVPLSRVTALQREKAKLSGEEGQLVAETARAKGRVIETELQIIQIGQDMRKEVTTDLRDVEGKIADLSERQVAALDQLRRIDIRTPQDGIVHQNSVHTVGGVIAAGEQIMLIIPEKDGLVVDARIEPQMIDRLAVDQIVRLRFSAFDTTTTPDLSGVLVRVSADLSQDQKTGQSFYTARIALADGELDKLAGKRLVPGMPVEAFIMTGERTALAYLVKPFEDQLARAFRY